ncbi:type I-U CRISPR-associated protein Cas8c [Desulfuromonas versatilis]|uniref:Type I-U CRISPR-associated protein Cas8c n=1 Tax=Desulfuromonas versatilis TaxID=2802975 RepID=A0ABN6E066_9BACT|nr:hypothetical protein [Desulfuromonas versatilis]BCR05676.1 type I-U CRISPR-associated protein Cas8c [Desulfuromonas versatilis]
MHSMPTPMISIPVDPSNPGQFFACCGLLELADRLWVGAEGWFENGHFCILTKDTTGSLSQMLEAAQSIRLSMNNAECNDVEPGEGDEDLSGEVYPLIIEMPINLRLDWWKDKSIKTWAGSMDERKIFIAMCHAIEPQYEDPMNQGTVVFDPSVNVSSGKRGLKRKKREPFYFDARRGANAWSIDVGFSPDSLAMTTLAYPAVEALCFIGLQRCRPKPTETPRVFDYFTWHYPLPIATIPMAVSGLLGNGDGFRFENAFRTDQRKHKAFNPATPIQRS